MTWYRSLGSWEWGVMGAFAIVYALFLWRHIRLARALGSNKGYIAAKFVLRSLYLGLILAALLGPAVGRLKEEIKATGKDVFICVDLSESMNAFDISPSRLEKVKFELKNLLRALSGDRIGLIVFSDEAFLQCPLTFDHSAVQVFIETLSTRVVGGGGTDLSAPIRMALSRFTQVREGQPNRNARVLVIISDGEDPDNDYKGAAQDAAKAGIRIFTLGTGTLAGSPIPDGNRFKTDAGGAQVISRLNPETLVEVARRSRGQYYELTAEINGFPALARDVAALEGEVIEVRKLDVAANKFTYPLLAAALLVLLDILVPIRILRLKR